MPCQFKRNLPMQEQSSSVESLPEVLEFDHRSSSSAAGMDQDVYWSSMLLHQEGTQNLPNFLLSPSDTNMSYVNMSTEDSPSLSIWSSGGPSSAEHSINQGNHDETKMELGWPASPLDGGSIEADNMLSLEDVDINLNNTQIDDEQSFSFPLSSNLNDIPQDIEPNASRVGDGVSESVLFSHPYVPSLIEREQGQSNSHPHGSSSAINGLMSGDYDDRSGSSLDSRRLTCKRKNIEGLPGQSSASGSTNFFHTGENNSAHSVSVRTNSSASMNISSPSSYTPGASSSMEQLNPRLSTISRGSPQNDYPPASVARNAESSRRNFRLRINPARQHDVYPPNLSISRNAIHNSSIWLPNEPSSNLIAFNRRLESRPVAAGSSSQNQRHIAVNPAPPRHMNLHPWNGAPNSRNGSLSSSLNSAELLTAIREDSVTRNTPRNDISVQSLFVPATEIRNLDVANGSASMGSTSRAGTNSGGHSSAGSTWIPHQEDQLSRGMAEIVHRRFLASVDSESRAQIRNFLLQRTAQYSTSLEVGHQSGHVAHHNQQSQAALVLDRQSDSVPLSSRSLAGHQSGHVSRHNQQSQAALVLDRQSDSVPLSSRSLAAREGRSRMISEIRNALDLMRRGEHLRFEDVFMLDHPLFHGVADLHDRHRDMRLDVDNMSYEELLALEERIGNVSTGISEEIILKHLNQRKHFPIGGGATVETEPCCICQEEYVEGEDLGTLDCGHDFHSACVKQWLMQKNLCPICKTTALVT